MVFNTHIRRVIWQNSRTKKNTKYSRSKGREVNDFVAMARSKKICSTEWSEVVDKIQWPNQDHASIYMSVKRAVMRRLAEIFLFEPVLLYL